MRYVSNLKDCLCGRLTATRMWLSSKDRVGTSAGADTAPGLKGQLGRPGLEPDSGTGDSIVSGGMTNSQRLVVVRLLRLRACSQEL